MWLLLVGTGYSAGGDGRQSIDGRRGLGHRRILAPPRWCRGPFSNRSELVAELHDDGDVARRPNFFRKVRVSK
jgi:hypothetical protein